PPRAKGAPPWARYPSASTNRPSAPRAPASTRPFASSTFPTALRTTSAPTTTSPARAAQVPTPPFIAPRGPSALPTVAPVPAPTAHAARIPPGGASVTVQPVALCESVQCPTVIPCTAARFDGAASLIGREDSLACSGSEGYIR